MTEILIGAVVVFILWKLRENTTTPPVSDPGVQDAFDEVGDLEANSGTLGDGKLATLNNATGNIGGTVGSFVASIWGGKTSAGLGTVGASLIDFGGVAAQESVAGKIAAATALTILPIVAYACGLAIAGAYAILAAIVIGFIVITEDVIANGVLQDNVQKGLQASMESKWQEIYSNTFTTLKTLFPDHTDWSLSRGTVHFADGFVEQVNRLNFLNALKETLALTEESGIWSYQLLYGYTATSARGFVRLGHLMYAWQHGRFYGAPNVYGINWQTKGADWNKYFKVSQGDGGFFLAMTPAQDNRIKYPWVRHGDRPEFIRQIPTGELVPRPADGFSEDKFASQYRAAGTAIANAAAFTAKMKEPWGLGQSEVSTMAFLVANGFVEGTVNPAAFQWPTLQNQTQVMCQGPGCLSYAGRQYYWRTSDGKTGVCARYDATGDLSAAESQIKSLRASLVGF